MSSPEDALALAEAAIGGLRDLIEEAETEEVKDSLDESVSAPCTGCSTKLDFAWPEMAVECYSCGERNEHPTHPQPEPQQVPEGYRSMDGEGWWTPPAHPFKFEDFRFSAYEPSGPELPDDGDPVEATAMAASWAKESAAKAMQDLHAAHREWCFDAECEHLAGLDA